MSSSPTPRELNTERVRVAEALGQGAYDAYPLRITFEITADCNLRCPHCEFTPPRAWKDKHDPHRVLHIGIEDIRRFAADVFPHIREVVPSVVGEPMMYPYWAEFVELCRHYEVYLEIYTNGTYLDERSLATLPGITSKLIVSMDGASRETFNMLRKPSDFDDVVGRLDQVRSWRAGLSEEDRPRVQIHGVLTTHWVDELVDMVRLAKEHGVDELSVGHLIANSDYWERYQPQNEPERTDAALRAAADEARRLGISVTLPRLFGSGENLSFQTAPAFPLRDKIDDLPQPPELKYWCKYLWREMFIALDGTVSPCCGVGRPEVDNLRVNYDVKGVFEHPLLAQMREGMASGDLHPACARCPQLAMYGGLDYEAGDFTSTYAALEGSIAAQRAKRDGSLDG